MVTILLPARAKGTIEVESNPLKNGIPRPMLIRSYSKNVGHSNRHPFHFIINDLDDIQLLFTLTNQK